MISGAQIRAARALLGWSQGDLSSAASVSERSLGMIEGPITSLSEKTMSKLQTSLEAAGIEFSNTDAGEGVFLTRPKPE